MANPFLEPEFDRINNLLDEVPDDLEERGKLLGSFFSTADQASVDSGNFLLEEVWKCNGRLWCVTFDPQDKPRVTVDDESELITYLISRLPVPTGWKMVDGKLIVDE